MKRRRAEIDAHVPEPAGPSEAILAKQISSCFNCGTDQEGYVFDSIGTLNALPVEPQDTSDFFEPTALSQACAEGPRATFCGSLSITNLLEFADPCRQFEFNVISTHTAVCWENVSRNLYITAEIAGHAIPAISLHASSSLSVLPNIDSLRISISPAWWSHASSFTITGLHHAGQLVHTQLLPANVIVVNMNHAPCNAGRLLMSSKTGDLTGVVSAIKDGCSTEESDDKVCIMIF